MTDQKRVYRKRRRAEQEAETARRITEAAVHLHGTLGPSRTSISAVAKHAGVRRSTLYRHFADEAALFHACTSHFMAMHPFPDPERWASIADPDERLAFALRALYALYGKTEQMMENVLRDASAMPIVDEMLGGYRLFLEAARTTLLAGRRDDRCEHREIAAAIGHALAFSTWRSLSREQGLSDRECAEMMRDLVAALSRR
jgi:AcrR family transcriptional regulator